MDTLVDPAVSRRKFDAEITQYRAIERIYCERGWFLLNAEFPEIFVVFVGFEFDIGVTRMGLNRNPPPA